MSTTTYPNRLTFSSTLGGESTINEDKENFALRMTNAIDVQLIDTNLYMSKELYKPFGARGAFGGQIIAQALHAGWNTVPDNFFIHSLHAYFILACNVETPVIYNVQQIRDGRSFATRIVTATQKGKAIFVCSCSFAKTEQGVNLNHQTDMPDVVDPDTLQSDLQLLQNALDSAEKFPEQFVQRAKRRLQDDQPIDFRDVITYSPEEIMTGDSDPNPCCQRWFKTRGILNDDLKLHALIIAYASDSGFLNTAAKANGFSFNSSSIGMMASLDHSMWFHKPARADEWLLYDMHSPRTSNGRGVAFGRIYSRDGILIATTAQEGVIRLSEIGLKRREKQAQHETTLKQQNSSSKSKL